MDKTVQAKQVEYRLVEFLGEGLNSCVYRAIKAAEKHGVSFEVALKILKSERLVAVWRNEFARLTTIQSKYCVRLLGWEFINEKPALVLEYVNGATLEMLKNNTQFTSDELKEIFTQASLGLLDLAAAGIFHGDLNFHNIMVDTSGTVKLVDFGVYDRDGALLTTPRFASRELLAGGQPDLQSDLYSLRAIIEEIIRYNKLKVSSDFWQQSHISNDETKRRLGAKILQVMQSCKSASGLTQRIIQIKKYAWTRTRILRLAILFALACPTLFSRGDERPKAQLKTMESSPLAYISVRSHQWIKIFVNNKSKGYAPLDIRLKTKDPIHLGWHNVHCDGQSTLTLRAGQHIVLGDDFFASKCGH